MLSSVAKQFRVNKRVRQLIELGEKLEQEYINKFIGKTISVLFETTEDNFYSGYSKEYVSVKALSDSDIKTKIYDVKITASENNYLIGEIIKK